MFVIAAVLFVLPCSLLWLTWRCLAHTASESVARDWRTFCNKIALLTALCSTALELMFFCSWFSMEAVLTECCPLTAFGSLLALSQSGR